MVQSSGSVTSSSSRIVVEFVVSVESLVELRVVQRDEQNNSAQDSATDQHQICQYDANNCPLHTHISDESIGSVPTAAAQNQPELSTEVI